MKKTKYTPNALLSKLLDKKPDAIVALYSDGLGGLTRESTKTESFATNAYKNPDDDPSLDTVKANIHTGWYVGGTPESKT